MRGTRHVQAIRLTIPAKPDYVVLARLALAGIARLEPTRLSAEAIADLKLALTDACATAVEHAAAAGRDSVQVVYEVHEDRVVIEVDDELEPGALRRGGTSLRVVKLL
jgi:serine/threonine-protein kinase RsbW